VDSPGTPVVLNFTNTENFFSCTTKKGEDTKILTVTVGHNSLLICCLVEDAIRTYLKFTVLVRVLELKFHV